MAYEVQRHAVSTTRRTDSVGGYWQPTAIPNSASDTSTTLTYRRWGARLTAQRASSMVGLDTVIAGRLMICGAF